ncbi:MAG TPA: protein-disulfide reductase DsbD domain-containing protein [Terriglobia bacterium]|nr:protein-disulfide reductase DsbD domain-containing protein [Terriglobia bacterium]
MRVSFLLLLLLLLFALSPGGAWGSQAADTHGSLQLVSEQQSIEPGHEFWIGLRFNLEKGWHIYWVNPGDSGEPPKVNWDLPAGFGAGDLQWPAPHRLEHPPLTDFGYEGEVLLLAPVHAPSQLLGRPPAQLAGGGGNATFAADVKWLVCRDICIPAHQRVTLSLAIRERAPKTDPNWRALFERSRSRLPQPAPVSWKSAVLAEGKDFVLSIESDASQAQATFFPLEPLQIENGAPQRVSAMPRGIRLTLEKSDQLLKPITNLRGVIVLGNGRAYVIDAPVFQNKRRTAS